MDALVGERRISYDARGLAEPTADVPNVAMVDGTAAVFEEMVRDEEKHADWFEAQLGAIERVGLPQYLSAQISTDAP